MHAEGARMFLIVILLLVFILILLLAKIYINVQYSFLNNEQELYISVSIYHIRILSKSMDLFRKQNLEETSFWESIETSTFNKQFDSVLSKIRSLNHSLQTVLRRTRLHEFTWSTDFGTGEASSTGTFSGVLWSGKGFITGYLKEKMILKCEPTIKVEPKFQDSTFSTNLDCTLSIRLGQIMRALIKVRRIMKKGGK